MPSGSLFHIYQCCAPAMVAMEITSKCRKCDMRSRKPSCCARGGSWFGNCGKAGDSNFDHTWPEGIQACKDMPRTMFQKAKEQITIRHHEVTIATELKNDRLRKGVLHQSIEAAPDSATHSGAVSSTVQFTNIASFRSLAAMFLTYSVTSLENALV